MTRKILSLGLEELIAQNEIREVFDNLLPLGFTGTSRNTLISYQRRFNQVSQERHRNTIDEREYNRELNRITNGLLDFIHHNRNFLDTGEFATPNIALKEVSLDPIPDDQNRRNAEAQEVEQWINFFENSGFNREQCRSALVAINEWKREPEFSNYRTWGKLEQSRENLEWSNNRFWGIFNFRPGQDKWVWLAWDASRQQFAFVKEVKPGCSNHEKISRLTWEKDIYLKIGTRSTSERLHQAADGVVSIIDHGDYWFATSFAQYGNLYWQLFESNRISEFSEGRLKPAERVQKAVFAPLPHDVFSGKNWGLVQSLFIQMANTLKIFHDSKYVHRDIHPANVLVNSIDLEQQKATALICDFDRTRKDYDNIELPNFLYLDGQELCAPERDRPFDNLTDEQLSAYHGLPTCDIYSLAATLSIALFGREVKDHGLRLRMLDEKIDWPKRLRKLLQDAMEINPNLRPNAEEFAQRLQSIRWRSPQEIKQRKRSRNILAIGSFLITALVIAWQPFWAWYNSDCRKYHCLKGNIEEDLHLSADKEYILEDKVFVLNSTLSIEAGTKIYGKPDAFLVIGRGAKIMADGAPYKPIVFTSWRDKVGSELKPEAGDWGGVAILGNAPVTGYANLEFCPRVNNMDDSRCNFGGDAPNDSSGVFRFVRIEYAGNVVDQNEEVNGLTLAGVGNRTKVEYVLVNKVIDDCFEFFGGAVKAHHLICQYPEDDAFDYENGFVGELRYLLMIGGPTFIRTQDPNEGGGRSGLEGSAKDEQSDSKGPLIANITLCADYLRSRGPKVKPINLDNDSKPTILNLLLSGYAANLNQRYCPIASLDISNIENLTICDKDSLFSGNCSQGIDQVKPLNPIPGQAVSNKDTTAFIGAFRSRSDNWDEKLVRGQ